jgi:hypothetical protein
MAAQLVSKAAATRQESDAQPTNVPPNGNISFKKAYKPINIQESLQRARTGKMCVYLLEIINKKKK